MTIFAVCAPAAGVVLAETEATEIDCEGAICILAEGVLPGTTRTGAPVR